MNTIWARGTSVIGFAWCAQYSANVPTCVYESNCRPMMTNWVTMTQASTADAKMYCLR